MKTAKIKVKRIYNDEGELIREEYSLADKDNPVGPACRKWNKEGQLIEEEYWTDKKESSEEDWKSNGTFVKFIH